MKFLNPKQAVKKPAVETKGQQYFFKYFTLGTVIFLLSLGSVLYVNLLLPPSEEQEWFALVGLIFSVPSGLLAFYCYIRLLIERFQHFLNK